MKNFAIVRKRQRQRRYNSDFNKFKEPDLDLLEDLDLVKKRLDKARGNFLLSPEINCAEKYLKEIKRYHHTAIKRIGVASFWNFQNSGLLLNYIQGKTSKERTLKLLNPQGRITTLNGAKKEFYLLGQQELFKKEIQKIEIEKGFIPDRLKILSNLSSIKLENISCGYCLEFARCEGLNFNCYNEKEYLERLEISKKGKNYLEGSFKIF